MKKKFILLLLFLGFFTISSCSREEINNTLLIYMCGSTLESKNGNASKNINEILSNKVPANTRVIIETGGSKKWFNYDIKSDMLSRYEITGNNFKLIDTIENSNMGDSNTLKEFITFGINYSNTKNISLMFWNHGGGSIDGVCMDSNYENDTLSLKEMKEALSQSNLEKKFNFIGFDACLMASYSTADILSEYADYMIASTEYEPASGWDYKSLTEGVSTNNLKLIVDGYADKQKNKGYYTLSLIDLNQFYKLKNVLASIVDKLNTEVKKEEIVSVLHKSTQYGSGSLANGRSNLFDLGQIANSLQIEFDFSDVIYKVTGELRTNTSGISLYFPLNDQKLDAFFEAIQSIDYKEYIEKYYSLIPEDAIIFDNLGYESDDKLSFIISENTINNVASVKYELFQNIPDDDFEVVYGIGLDNDVIKKNNNFTINFNGNWIYFNDELIYTEIIEENDSYTLFAGSVLVNDEKSSLIIKYDKTLRIVTLEGFTNDEGELNSRVDKLESGMKITVLYNDKTADIYNMDFQEGNSFIYNETINLDIKVLPDGYYTYRGIVEDIYGNLYITRSAVVLMTNGIVSIYFIS